MTMRSIGNAHVVIGENRRKVKRDKLFFVLLKKICQNSLICRHKKKFVYIINIWYKANVTFRLQGDDKMGEIGKQFETKKEEKTSSRVLILVAIVFALLAGCGVGFALEHSVLLRNFFW